MNSSQPHHRAQSIIDEIDTKGFYVFSTSRKKSFLYFLILLISTILCAFMIPEKEVMGWIGVFLCGGFSILALVLAWKPSCLYLSREGLSVRALLRSYSYKWGDIEGFNVLKYRLSRMVIINFPREGQPDAGVLVDALTRKREVLADFYSIPPEEMADLLRTLRTHFLEEKF